MIDRLVQTLNPRAEAMNGSDRLGSLRFLSRGIRVATTPRNRLLKATLHSGVTIRGYNRPGYGGRGIYMFRENVEPELQIFIDLLERGDWAVDVGSCVGTYALTAANRIGPGGAVVAIDPNPEAMSILTDNAALNNLRNVLPICAAASEGWGFAEFDAEHDRPDARGIVRSGKPAQSQRVMTVSIDDVLSQAGDVATLRAMKVDAEGAEDLVLRGAKTTIATWKPVIVIEQAVRGVDLLDGYETWSTTPSRNQVWVHRDDARASDILASHGFAPGA